MAAYTAIPSTAHPAGIMDQINNPSTNAETKKALRNSFIEAAIFEIRESHRYYWTNAAMHRAWFNFSMDTLIAASTAVIASAGGKGTKAAIGAAATAIGGIKGAFSSDFDAAQSRTQLLAAMEINSTRNAEAIQTKTAKPYSEYEFAEACVDINKLYESGSEGYTYSTVTETPKK